MNIGIDIGGSHIGIGVVNEDGMIVEKVKKRIMSQEKKNIKKRVLADKLEKKAFI